MAYLLSGILTLAVAGATLWFCMPKNSKPLVNAAVAPYIAVAITMGLLVGLGATMIGLGRLLFTA
jgi:hypothetical protein